MWPDLGCLTDVPSACWLLYERRVVSLAAGADVDDGLLKTGGSMTTAAIIGIVIALFFVILVIADISCYFLNNCGVTKTICINVCNEDDGNGKLVADPEKGGQG